MLSPRVFDRLFQVKRSRNLLMTSWKAFFIHRLELIYHDQDGGKTEAKDGNYHRQVKVLLLEFY